jgi:drug/metabolite transporter (DMT)-like permease
LIYIKHFVKHHFYFGAVSTTALILVLIASLTHAAWNFLAKKTNGGIEFIWLIYTLSTIIFFPFILFLTINKPFTLSVALVLVCIVSGGLRLLYFVILQTGYRKADLSVVYPLARGSAPLFATIGAITLMHEAPTPYTVAGLILIIVGVIVITGPNSPQKNMKLKAGVTYGIITGIMIAIYTLWDKLAISHFKLSPLIITFSSHVIGAIVLAPKALRNKWIIKHELKHHWWHMTVIAILSPVSYLLILEAMKTTDVIYIAPAREVSILFGVMLGGQLMAEKDTKRRLIASCLILSGVVILAM